jgi:hypothetical protein
MMTSLSTSFLCPKRGYAQTMLTNVSKCKNDKIKGEKKKEGIQSS